MMKMNGSLSYIFGLKCISMTVDSDFWPMYSSSICMVQYEWFQLRLWSWKSIMFCSQKWLNRISMRQLKYMQPLLVLCTYMNPADFLFHFALNVYLAYHRHLMRPSLSLIHWVRNHTRTVHWSCNSFATIWPCGLLIFRYCSFLPFLSPHPPLSLIHELGGFVSMN